MRVMVDYPDPKEELTILKKAELRHFENLPILTKTSPEEVLLARRAAQNVFISDAVREYIVSLVTATREPKKYDAQLAQWLSHGASPRATLSLLKTSKALAYLRGQAYVTPEHVQTVAPDVLGHRIYPSYESESDNISRSEIIGRLLQFVATP
jgi:MoxR-like ATPase